LCGFSTRVEHLDGRILVLNSAPGQIIRPGDQKAVANEGMPHYKRSLDKGQLIINVCVASCNTQSCMQALVGRLACVGLSVLTQRARCEQLDHFTVQDQLP
jgi:DnaJ-class molecular chaperone